MRTLNDKINLFCLRHPGFGIPRLMTIIVIGNLAVWLLAQMDTTRTLLGLLQFSPELIFQGQIWRLVSFLFIPESFRFTFALWLLMYYAIGNGLEQTWGTGKFSIYYLTGVVLTVVYQLIVWLVVRNGSGAVWYNTLISTGTTSHYINLSLFLAYATLYPDSTFLLFGIIPLKAWWLAIADALMFAYDVFTGIFPSNLLPVVAVVNYFIFCGQWLFALVGVGRVQRQKNVVDFQREARRINRENREKPYSRKCEVCSRTDADFPDLEFRYCSRCSGYHCYCQDHINDHVHHTDSAVEESLRLKR